MYSSEMPTLNKNSFDALNNVYEPTDTSFDSIAEQVDFKAFAHQYHQNNYDCMRRFSYAELLSSQSETSLSDIEQQTPSPSQYYEDYIYHQQQQSLEEKRPGGSVEMAACYDYLSETPMPLSLSPNDYGYNPMQQTSSWILSGMGCQYSHQIRVLTASSPMLYSQADPNACGLVNSYTQLAPPPFEYHPLSPCVPMTAVDTSASTAAPTPVIPSMSMVFRERSSSTFSVSTSSSLDPCAIPEKYERKSLKQQGRSAQAAAVAAATAAGKHQKQGQAKPSRSRGRRVSNSPSAAGQKMFTCTHDDCGKVFKRSEHLKRHIRSIHTLEKPFKCPYLSCSKCFSRSDNLNQHIRIHRHTGKEKSMHTGPSTPTLSHNAGHASNSTGLVTTNAVDPSQHPSFGGYMAGYL